MTGNQLRHYRRQCPTLGNRVRRGPNNDIMSQLELASLMGVHRNTVTRWESLGDKELPPMVSTLLIGVETLIKNHADEVKRHQEAAKQQTQDSNGVEMRGIDQRTTAELSTSEDVR